MAWFSIYYYHKKFGIFNEIANSVTAFDQTLLVESKRKNKMVKMKF